MIIRAKETLLAVSSSSIVAHLKIQKIKKYIGNAERQIDQIRRRVVEGETIPNSEKVFSLFEEHTEWISKGKAGVLQELGPRVCVIKNQFGFILHHRVMQKETDDQITIRIIQETKDTNIAIVNMCYIIIRFLRYSEILLWLGRSFGRLAVRR